MPTVTNTIGSAGRDFSTLASWAASLPANLVTDGNSYVGACYNDSEFTGTTELLVLSGHTTDSTHTITLTTGAGQSFRDAAGVQTNQLDYLQANGVAITSNGNASGLSVISISDNNVTISNLQIKNDIWIRVAILQLNPAAELNINNCILKCTGTQYSGQSAGSFGQHASLRNCLLITTGAIAGTTCFRDGQATVSGGAQCYNCTFVASSDATNVPNEAILTAGGYATSTIFENCAMFGCTNAFTKNLSGSTPTFTTCMTDAAGSTGITGGKTYANQFQGTTVAGGDFRVKAGADLLDVGTTDATNGASDIVGTTRPQGSAYDIGAWELVVAGGPTLMGAMVM